MKKLFAAILCCSISSIAFAQPEINVTGNAITIADGDVTPSFSDWTEYISILECTGTVVRSYTIQNTGTTDLQISSVTITGPEATDFTITGFPVTTIAAGGSSVMWVTCNPIGLGPRNATVVINSDDSDESVYDFAIRGTGLADVVNPTITCPGNIGVNATAGLCSAVVTFATPSATDNCPTAITISQTAGLPSGSAFPVGATVNTFRATDASGNFSTCSFTVTVNDAQAPVLYNMSTVASSNAAGGAYSDGWHNGDNDGSGFGAWTLNASTGNLTQAGFTVSSSLSNGSGIDSNGDQDINSGGLALGMYANSAQATQATRALSSPLVVGRTLRLEFDNGAVDNGQIVGFQLQNSSGNSLGEVRHRGGQIGYELVDNNGITPFSSVWYTDEGIIIEVTPTAVGIVSIKLTRKDNGATQTLTSISFPGGGNQTIARFMIFNSNAGAGPGYRNHLYANNFSVSVANPGCPSTISVSNDPGICGAIVSYNPVVAIDNCNTSLTVTQTSGLASGSVFPVGTTTNSFSVTDGAGNTSACSFNVTVTDTSRPVANCNNLSLYLNGSGSANIIAAMVNNGSTDNCGVASVSISPTSFSCANVGVNNVILTVTDAAGNSSTCTSVVTVLDSIRPIANCQNLTVQLNAAGSATVIPAMLNNGSSDNCGIASMSISQNSFTCANIGANNVTLTVTDNSGNSSTCIAVVTVADTVRPVAICQSGTIQIPLDGTGNATILASLIDNGSSDACGISLMTVSPNTFTCASQGFPTLTLTVTDNNGNTSTCTSTAIVYDNVPPIANCQNINLYLDGSGNANITPAMVNNGSTDECQIATMNISTSSFNCNNVGSNNVTLTIFDTMGATDQCVSVVTVIDSIRPVVNCQNITLQLNAAGTANLTPAMINNGSTDNCGIASMSVSQNSFSCANIGANTVTLTVTDNSGNSSACTAIVTVADTVRPVAIAQNVTVTMSGGIATVLAASVDNGSYDACGIASMVVTPNPFTCANLGPNTVTLTVTDMNGNSSTATAVATILSDLASSATATNNVSCFGGSNGQATVTTTGGAGIFTYSWSPSGGTAATASGLTAGTYTCTVTDGGGCTTSSTVSITEPVSALTASSVSGSVLCNGGSTTVTVTGNGGTSPYTGAGTFTVTAGAYSYTVTDANGCTATTSITVTEPAALTANSTSTSVFCAGGAASITVTGSGGTSPYTGTGIFPVVAGTFSYTITDVNGCTATTSITVTEPTVLTASSSSTSVLCNGGNATVTVAGSGGTSPYTGTGTFTVGAGTYSYTVTDANGCTATTSITLTEPTVLTASSSSTSILCNGGTATVTVTGSGGTAPYTGEGTFTVGAGTYSYTVTDANGCTATTSITVTEPTALTASSSSTSILCNGGNATVTVAGSGGTSPYTGTGTFTVGAGTYSYTVTDANGCTATTSITITEPTAISSSVTTVNVNCNGGSDGSIDLTVSGGTTPYTYDWNSGAYTTEDLTGLAAGTYSGVLTDANGCTSSGTVVITEPPVLLANVTSVTNPGTCGGTDGAIDITISGGTAGYTYLWNNSATSEDLLGISAGSYSCTVTDANGCSANASATLSDPNAPAVFLSLPLDTLCFDDVALTLTGESPVGGTFSGPGVSSGSFTPAVAGIGTHEITYTYTDLNGCTGSTTDSLYVDACLRIATPEINVFDVYPNPNNGTFTIQINGTGRADVLIYDAQGKLVVAQNVQRGSQVLMNMDAPGVYMITLLTAEGRHFTKRVIVND